jgi:hypothetical protein
MSEEKQFTPDEIVDFLVNEGSEDQDELLRKFIILAEDTQFSVEQSKKLSSWLLNYALEHRNSQDQRDEAVVWSAIRTGASMLTPDEIGVLRPLLDPHSAINTTLVTVKMVGRIFEAQPYEDEPTSDIVMLSHEIYEIVQATINPYAITSPASGALGALSVYALVGMRSMRGTLAVDLVNKTNIKWFGEFVHKDICDLKEIWEEKKAPEGAMVYLNELIKRLEKNNGE